MSRRRSGGTDHTRSAISLGSATSSNSREEPAGTVSLSHTSGPGSVVPVPMSSRGVPSGSRREGRGEGENEEMQGRREAPPAASEVVDNTSPDTIRLSDIIFWFWECVTRALLLKAAKWVFIFLACGYLFKFYIFARCHSTWPSDRYPCTGVLGHYASEMTFVERMEWADLMIFLTDAEPSVVAYGFFNVDTGHLQFAMQLIACFYVLKYAFFWAMRPLYWIFAGQLSGCRRSVLNLKRARRRR